MNIGLSNEERKAVGMDLGDRRRIFWGGREGKEGKNTEIWALVHGESRLK